MKQYHDLLRDIMTNGEGHDDRTGVGTKSVFGRQFRHDMRNGFPLLTTKRLSWKNIVTELKWFLSGSSDVKKLQEQGNTIWDEWATKEQCAKFGREEGDLGPVYGVLWREYPVGWTRGENPNHPSNVDQIEWLLKEISAKPNSRRLIVSGWHPFYQQRVALPPCHTLWQIKCHEHAMMSLHLYARSIDTFLGLPYNIASYALLLSVIAKLTNYIPRDLIISFGDVHIYNNHHEQVKLQLSRTPKQLPWLELENVKSITEWDASIRGYDPDPSIKAEVAV